ncbi:ECF-type sigma factor [soil metagenome]
MIKQYLKLKPYDSGVTLPDAPITDDSGDMFAAVYGELHRLAQRAMAYESPGQTLQPTALVHEAYFRLLSGQSELAGDRGKFFAAAANAMRQILIDTARSKNAIKRGGSSRRTDIDPDQIAAPEAIEELLALDEALTKLTALDPVVAEVVTLRYFAGLNVKETAETLGISPRTADSYWAFARSWLSAEIQKMSS